MDGMNQNNNNDPYGQQNNTYQVNDPNQQNNAYQPNNPYYHNPYQPQDNPYQQQVNPAGQMINPYNPQKKGFGVKIAVGIVCALVVMIGIGVGVLAYYRSTPSYKISKGFQNLAKEIVQIGNPLADKIDVSDILRMMQEDGGHVETKLNFLVNVPSFGETTLGVDTDFYKDVHAKEMSADTSFSVMNIDFAHLNIYANDEVFCFSVPELFMENLYIENENVVSQYNDSIFGNFYPSYMEDFSINLFPDENKRVSLRDLKNLSVDYGNFDGHLEAFLDKMTIEKAEKGLYRVTFPQHETDRVVKDLLEYSIQLYGNDQTLEELTEALKEYTNFVDSDVSFLFEIDGKNRIKSIMLESPIEMLDGDASIEGELLFRGETRSIDKIQGKIAVNGADGKPTEALWQIQLTADDDEYRMDMDLKLSEAEKTLGKMKYVMDCDAVKDRFDFSYSLKTDRMEVSAVIEGSIDDYEKGESIEIDLDKAEVSYTSATETIDVIKISGDISIEPLKNTIKPSVEPETAFFEMSYLDWLGIIYQLDDEYGGLLGSLYDGLLDSIW